jgi:hypothetical protein
MGTTMESGAMSWAIKEGKNASRAAVSSWPALHTVSSSSSILVIIRQLKINSSSHPAAVLKLFERRGYSIVDSLPPSQAIFKKIF